MAIFKTKMSMIPKTETNVPGSRPSLSFESIMKDLQDLSKNVASQNVVNALEAKMEKLEKENQKLKADLLSRESELVATEKKRKLYYNLFHGHVKIVAELKAENESLKAEIETSKYFLTEENKVAEISTSGTQSAIRFNEIYPDLTHKQPLLAIGNGLARSTQPSNKRRYFDDDTTMNTNRFRKRSEQTLHDRPPLFDFFHKKWGKKLSLRLPPRFDEN